MQKIHPTICSTTFFVIYIKFKKARHFRANQKLDITGPIRSFYLILWLFLSRICKYATRWPEPPAFPLPPKRTTALILAFSIVTQLCSVQIFVSYSTPAAIAIDCDSSATGSCAFVTGSVSSTAVPFRSPVFVSGTLPVEPDRDTAATGSGAFKIGWVLKTAVWFCLPSARSSGRSNDTVFLGCRLSPPSDSVGGRGRTLNFVSFVSDRLFGYLVRAFRGSFRLQGQCAQQFRRVLPDFVFFRASKQQKPNNSKR